MTTDLIIFSPETGKNARVYVRSADQIDGGVFYRVLYKARDAREVDCFFGVIERDGGLFCQASWTGMCATAEDYDQFDWVECDPVLGRR